MLDMENSTYGQYMQDIKSKLYQAIHDGDLVEAEKFAEILFVRAVNDAENAHRFMVRADNAERKLENVKQHILKNFGLVD